MDYSTTSETMSMCSDTTRSTWDLIPGMVTDPYRDSHIYEKGPMGLPSSYASMHFDDQACVLKGRSWRGSLTLTSTLTLTLVERTPGGSLFGESGAPTDP